MQQWLIESRPMLTSWLPTILTKFSNMFELAGRLAQARQLARSNMTVPPSDRGTACLSVSDSVDPQ